MKLNSKELVKGALQLALEKEGHTLMDFEAYLKGQAPVEKRASLEKTSNTVIDLLKGLSQLSTAAAIGTGAAGGLGGYYGYKNFVDTQDSINDKYKQQKQIIDANKVMQNYLAEHQLKQSKR